MFHVKSAVVETLHHKSVDLSGRRGDCVPIDSQKDIYDRERNSLVSINEWVVLHEAFQKMSGDN
jgi:hypothetical protein